ncbi:MAG TPA: Ig-like domain-containing protein [Verrucomicrobiae bacterium]
MSIEKSHLPLRLPERCGFVWASAQNFPFRCHLIVAFLVASMCQFSWARPWRPGQLPNGGVFSCANCHIDPAGGGPRNPFGQAVEAELVRLYGNAVGEQRGFWSAALAVVDSDSDGFSNGEELSDPAGTWIPGQSNPPGSVTNPGNPTSHPFNAPPSVAITNPVSGTVFTVPAAVTIQAVAADSDGTITKVQFFDGATLLGSSTNGPYGITVLLSSLGDHGLTAVATDNRGAVTSSAVVPVTVQPGGMPPTVAIISPPDGATFTNTPVTFLLQASASDQDGSVTNVEFFDGPVSLGSVSTSPFSLQATLSYGGSHNLTAVARDDAGWAVASAEVTVTVQGGRLWEVEILDLVFSPASVTIKVGDAVRWTARGALSHTINSGGPYLASLNSGSLTNGNSFVFTFTNAGIFSYYCLAHGSFDGGGSQRGTVVVQPIAPPVVALITPTNHETFTTHDTVTMAATASDPNGSITRVEFLDYGQPIGTLLTNEPYSLNLTLLPGPHELAARATDSENGIATSGTVAIQVNTVPILNPIPARITKGDLTIELRPVAGNLASPLGMAVPDDGSGRMFIYDQSGFIRVLSSTGLVAAPLLDVRSELVALNNYDERGLLGLAAHPNFVQFPFIYTYTSQSNSGPADFTSIATNHNHQSVIAEWRLDAASANQVDPLSRREIMRIDEPQANHNGGTLRFGPDGYLYIALGDGGRADDQGEGHEPNGNAQSLWNVYGKLLRIDVDGTNALNGQYGIPDNNPFHGWGLVEEIFAYGLRNPFSYSFDRHKRDLYLGDVGQNKVEEIDLVVSGGNYGWRVKEGTFYFDPNGTNAGYVTDTPVVLVVPDVINPIAQYDHDDGLAVIGGYIYRGNALPALEGRYIFGDWGSFGAPSGRLFYLDETNGVKEFRLGLDDRALGYWIKGFGEDADGELYVMASRSLGPSGDTGRVFKIVAPPEPVRITTVTADSGGAMVTFRWSAVAGRLYQVQFKTDLNQSNWSDLGGVLTATSVDMWASDAVGAASQRFYRVVPLP